MKMNNGCGDRLIVKDKSQYTNSQIWKHFKSNKEYGVMFGEYHYQHIKPLIIAEKLLIDNNSTSD
jgi:hypothetical protein